MFNFLLLFYHYLLNVAIVHLHNIQALAQRLQLHTVGIKDRLNIADRTLNIINGCLIVFCREVECLHLVACCCEVSAEGIDGNRVCSLTELIAADVVAVGQVCCDGLTCECTNQFQCAVTIYDATLNRCIRSSASAQIKLVIEVKKHRIIIFLIIAFIKIHFLHFVIIQYFLHFFMRITDKRVLIR